MPEKQYLFIDGGCLRATLQRLSKVYFGGDEIDLRYDALSQFFDKTFYYDSPPHQKANEPADDFAKREQAQLDFFDSLRGINGWHVYEGETRLRRREVQQKKVDIMIAVDMLTHSFRRNMSRVAFLTGDLDFKPLVDALVQAGMYVTLWYPPGHTNSQLIHAADARKLLDIDTVYSWTSDHFRQTHSIPKVHTQVGLPNMGAFELLTTWENRQESEVKLYRRGGSHHVVTEDVHNPRHGLTVFHSSLGPLKAYVEEKYPFVNWPDDAEITP